MRAKLKSYHYLQLHLHLNRGLCLSLVDSELVKVHASAGPILCFTGVRTCCKEMLPLLLLKSKTMNKTFNGRHSRPRVMLPFYISVDTVSKLWSFILTACAEYFGEAVADF